MSVNVNYSPYDPQDIVRYHIENNWRPNNFFGETPTIKAVFNQRNIPVISTKDNYVRTYLIIKSPITSDDAQYDFMWQDALIGVDIQCANRAYLMKCVFETVRSILQSRKAPEPINGWWDLMYVQDEIDRSHEFNKIWHYVLDVKLEKISQSIITMVNINEGN